MQQTTKPLWKWSSVVAYDPSHVCHVVLVKDTTERSCSVSVRL